MDQSFWSAAFLLMNVAAMSRLSVVEFANLAVATSVGLIGVAAVRALVISGSILAGASRAVAPHLSVGKRRPLIGAIAGATAAAITTAAILHLQGSDHPVYYAIFAASLILGDIPKQVLVATLRYGLALIIAIVYLIGSIAIFSLFLPIQSHLGILVAWSVILGVAGLLGYMLQAKKPVTEPPLSDFFRYGWRNAAEALYGGIASQLVIFISFWLNDPNATAGIRLSYSLVFAAAFMIVQGLTPILVNSLANARISGINGGLRRITVVWSLGVTLAFSLSGMLALIPIELDWANENFDNALPFLLPVGINIIGGQVLELALLGSRFVAAPEHLHRIRIYIVATEILLILVAGLVGAADGLLFAYIIIGIGKLALASIMIFRLR